MTAAAESPADEHADEHAGLWLTPDQLASWLSVVRLITRLPWAIDAQLQRDADLSMIEYMTMAMLGEAPQRTMRMSDLAERTSSSLSRLSHLVKRLEGRGYVRREADPADGRFTNAILLPRPAQDGVGGARARGARPPPGHRQPVPRAAAPARPGRRPDRGADRLARALTRPGPSRADVEVIPPTVRKNDCELSERIVVRALDRRELVQVDEIQAERLDLGQHPVERRTVGQQAGQHGMVALPPRHHGRERAQHRRTQVAADTDLVAGRRLPVAPLADAGAARRALERALDLAKPEGLLFPFLIAPAPDLLERHRRLGTAHAVFISEILNVLAGRKPVSRPDEPQHLREPLSQAEARVLRYLPTKLSTPEIADQLYLSVNTVKTHMRHLYDKLGVHRRHEAVEQARALGLLAPSSRR